MTALRSETDGRIRFAGVGGPRMQAAGLDSLFDPGELALLGVFEVLPAVFRVMRRVRETLADIERCGPNVLVTIDSWGFTGRIHERLAKAGSALQRMRYVAPQVWAWRPGRARQLARWIHHLMALLPFEPPYFTAVGLPTTWVGHPVVESGIGNGDGSRFRAAHGLSVGDLVLAVLPGSRRGEVRRLLPVFRKTIDALAHARTPQRLVVVIPTVATVADLVKEGTEQWDRPVIVTEPAEMADAIAAAQGAIAASGTVSLELAAAGVPHLIAYRVNAFSAFAFRLLRRTRFVNLVNVLLGREAVPELLQERCAPAELAAAVASLLDDQALRRAQLDAFREALAKLTPQDGSPSRLAARTVLDLAGKA
jgi:lipid-A-disaccharide synthase